MNITAPEELNLTLKRLLMRVPYTMREDERVQQTALLYLKLGGTKLAGHYLQTTARFWQSDPLDMGRSLNFPKINEMKSESEADDDDDDSDDNENDGTSD